MADASFSLPIRVYYEDTDAAGVVYYANYLRFLERARTEWLAFLGHDVVELASAHGIVFIVRRVEIDYLKPARLCDLLDVSVSVHTLGRASLIVHQRVLRGGEALVHASVRLACVDRDRMLPTRIPSFLDLNP
ncbi:MAG TPA: tol-pal system-associated acyl-CoA thioesterase [Casimicrobiaceae bacterium]|nr:tol-pal system-associated acyl-CoA thioesterase [Casimicrobiaceae bacterium]